MSRRKRKPKRKNEQQTANPPKIRQPRCITCGTQMVLEGGFAETGMCGPCATGEAATLAEIGLTW